MPRRPRTRAPASSRALLDAQVAERDLLHAIINLVQYLHGKAHHCYDSRLCGPDPGMPDLIIVLRGRVIFVETKVEGKELAVKQQEWRTGIEAAGDEYYLWQPHDWTDGTIEVVLTRQDSPYAD